MTPTRATRSTRTKPRVSARGRSSRFVLSAVVVALFVLVPAAQAFAEEAHLKLNIVGSGSGEVISQAEPVAGLGRGTPPIKCSYDGTSMQGACENVPDLLGEEAGLYAEELHAIPTAGSKVVGWTVERGAVLECPVGGDPAKDRCLLLGEDGEGIEWEITAEFALVSQPSFKLNLHSSGAGAGSFMCEVNGGGEETCKPEYEEGTHVAVVPHAGAHSVFGEFTSENGGQCSGASCEFTMTSEKTANAKFEPVTETFTESVTGPGKVECKDETISSGFGPCAASYPYGHTIAVTATPTGGSTLRSISGTGSARLCTSSPCVFTIEEPSTVSVTFNAAVSHPSTLDVFKGGNGAGTVTSNPSGISCGSEPCEAVFEEGDLITLEAHPATGSVFAGWLGCRHLTATTCQVKLGSPEVEVTAIFLIEGKEGTNGKEGPEGKAGKEGTTGKEGATGKEGTTGKEGPEGKAGKEGSHGEIGFPGPEGPQGQTGQTGSQGAQGTQGAQGAQGPVGNPGAMGPQGKQGPAGAAAKVTCKVKQQKNASKVKVTCMVTYQSTTASTSTVRVRWSLTHNGRIVRRGVTGYGRLRLGYLHSGRYRLHIQGQKGSRLIVVG